MKEKEEPDRDVIGMVAMCFGAAVYRKKKQNNADQCFDVKSSTVMHDSVTSRRFSCWGDVVNDVRALLQYLAKTFFIHH